MLITFVPKQALLFRKGVWGVGGNKVLRRRFPEKQQQEAGGGGRMGALGSECSQEMEAGRETRKEGEAGPRGFEETEDSAKPDRLSNAEKEGCLRERLSPLFTLYSFGRYFLSWALVIGDV